MGTDPRAVWALWLPLLVVAGWVAATAPFSVTATAWGLAVLSAGAAAVRWTLPERSVFAIRRRAVDVQEVRVSRLDAAYVELRCGRMQAVQQGRHPETREGGRPLKNQWL